MSFIEKSSAKDVKPRFLEYTYPITELFKEGQVKENNISTVTALVYYDITYPIDINQGKVTGKLSYTEDNHTSLYIPTKMYIHGLLHNNITGLTSGTGKDEDIIGELVIEHKKNNNDDKLFLCILLKRTKTTIGGTPTNIENIITMKKSDSSKNAIRDGTATNKAIDSIVLDLNKDIPSNQKCVKYNDSTNENNIVIVLTEPILLGTADGSKTISELEPTTDLFSIHPRNNYETDTNQLGKNKAIGADDVSGAFGKHGSDDIYIDCQPTGPGLEEIKEMQTYNIPIGSALSQDMQKLDFMKTSVNFFLFCLGLILLYMGVPMLYKMAVIDKTIENVEGNAERLKTIRSADVLIVIAFAVYILASFYYGFKGDGDISMITNGLFGFVILGISISLIMIKKLDSEYMRKGDVTVENNNSEQSQADAQGVFAIISRCFAFLFSVKGSLLHVLVCDFIAVVMLASLYGAGTITKPTFDKYCFKTLLIYIPLWVSLFIFLSSSGPV
jgi:hypothetical protein